MNRIRIVIASSLMLATSLLTATISAADGVEVSHRGVNNTMVRITGAGKYLLLPVQESNDDAKVSVLADGKIEKTINVRLAKSKVDYFVPFDLAPYRGHDILLNIVTTQNRSNIREAKDDA